MADWWCGYKTSSCVCVCHTDSSLHPAVKLEPDRRRRHGSLRRTYFVHGERALRRARCFCGDHFDDFGMLCLHSLLEQLNPKPLNLNEGTEDPVVIQRLRSWQLNWVLRSNPWYLSVMIFWQDPVSSAVKIQLSWLVFQESLKIYLFYVYLSAASI